MDVMRRDMHSPLSRRMRGLSIRTLTFGGCAGSHSHSHSPRQRLPLESQARDETRLPQRWMTTTPVRRALGGVSLPQHVGVALFPTTNLPSASFPRNSSQPCKPPLPWTVEATTGEPEGASSTSRRPSFPLPLEDCENPWFRPSLHIAHLHLGSVWFSAASLRPSRQLARASLSCPRGRSNTIAAVSRRLRSVRLLRRACNGERQGALLASSSRPGCVAARACTRLYLVVLYRF